MSRGTDIYKLTGIVNNSAVISGWKPCFGNDTCKCIRAINNDPTYFDPDLTRGNRAAIKNFGNSFSGIYRVFKHSNGNTYIQIGGSLYNYSIVSALVNDVCKNRTYSNYPSVIQIVKESNPTPLEAWMTDPNLNVFDVDTNTFKKNCGLGLTTSPNPTCKTPKSDRDNNNSNNSNNNDSDITTGDDPPIITADTTNNTTTTPNNNKNQKIAVGVGFAILTIASLIIANNKENGNKK